MVPSMLLLTSEVPYPTHSSLKQHFHLLIIYISRTNYCVKAFLTLPSRISLFLWNKYIYWFIPYLRVHACYSTCVDIIEQVREVSSHPLPSGPWRSSSVPHSLLLHDLLYRCVRRSMYSLWRRLLTEYMSSLDSISWDLTFASPSLATWKKNWRLPYRSNGNSQ